MASGQIQEAIFEEGRRPSSIAVMTPFFLFVLLCDAVSIKSLKTFLKTELFKLKLGVHFKLGGTAFRRMSI